MTEPTRRYTEWGVSWRGLERPMLAVSLQAAVATALLLNDVTSDGNLAFPVRREVTDWEEVID
jgi:hypothetical protein